MTTDILENLSDRLQSIKKGLWHKLAYHVCAPCSWDEVIEYETISTDVPDFEVNNG